MGSTQPNPTGLWVGLGWVGFPIVTKFTFFYTDFLSILTEKRSALTKSCQETHALHLKVLIRF